MATEKKPKNNIKDFKDRMTSPLSIVVTSSKNHKPKTTKKKGK